MAGVLLLAIAAAVAVEVGAEQAPVLAPQPTAAPDIDEASIAGGALEQPVDQPAADSPSRPAAQPALDPAGVLREARRTPGAEVDSLPDHVRALGQGFSALSLVDRQAIVAALADAIRMRRDTPRELLALVEAMDPDLRARVLDSLVRESPRLAVPAALLVSP